MLVYNQICDRVVKTGQFHIKDYILKKKLDAIQLSDPNNIHPKVLKELTEAITEPLNIIYEFLGGHSVSDSNNSSPFF